MNKSIKGSIVIIPIQDGKEFDFKVLHDAELYVPPAIKKNSDISGLVEHMNNAIKEIKKKNTANDSVPI